MRGDHPNNFKHNRELAATAGKKGGLNRPTEQGRKNISRGIKRSWWTKKFLEKAKSEQYQQRLKGEI